MKYLILPIFILFTGCGYLLSKPEIIEDLIQDESKAVEDVIRDCEASK